MSLENTSTETMGQSEDFVAMIQITLDANTGMPILQYANMNIAEVLGNMELVKQAILENKVAHPALVSSLMNGLQHG